MKRLTGTAIIAALTIAAFTPPAEGQGLPTFCNGLLTTSTAYTRQASATVLEYHVTFQNQDPSRRAIFAYSSPNFVTIPGFMPRYPLSSLRISFGQPEDLVFLTLTSSSVGFGIGSPPVPPTPSAALAFVKINC